MTSLAQRITSGLRLPTRLRARAVPLVAGVAGIVAVALFGWASAFGSLDPGRGIGYGFGVGAALALVAVMLYSARRGAAKVRALGRTQTYLEIHLWAGGLFVILFLFHTRFGVPDGLFTTLLWVVALWVAITGVVGMMLQRWVPRILASAAPFEVHLRRIPELVETLKTRAEAVVADVEPRLKAFYEQELASELERPHWAGLALFARPTTGAAESRAAITLRRTLSDRGAAVLDELFEIHATKRELDVHYTLQRTLRGWLYLHLPVGVALLGLVALHVFFTTYF